MEVVSVLAGSLPAVSTLVPAHTLESNSGVVSVHGLISPLSPSPDPLVPTPLLALLDQSTLLDAPILISPESADDGYQELPPLDKAGEFT
ncbi:hypothetical protein NDU88_003528 [Pleurodeles waltl]|uniref:Secreted protein n=1 Tax=Pleurodeles waltl TaxID=8319 RepID=A0AAV7PIE6_PLEWA|nr:hypothetical protein NDU88_003528 [Pleurodeles waltl]